MVQCFGVPQNGARAEGVVLDNPRSGFKQGRVLGSQLREANKSATVIVTFPSIGEDKANFLHVWTVLHSLQKKEKA
jgi:hypothetical protein